MPQFDSPRPIKTPVAAEEAVGRAAYMALIAALLGWMFDGFEMGVFSLVGSASVKELLRTQDDQIVKVWISVITACFLIGAATGGVVFGWLGDRVGRVRAMTLSVLTYALFTGVCGFCTEAWHVGAFRFIAALGMGGEWSLGVALVMEVWPNRSRAFMAGLIGAAANVGYLLVGVVGLVLASFIGNVEAQLEAFGYTPEQAHAMLGDTGWRLIMVLGTLPALLTFFIRSFVPESEKWEKQQESGATSHFAASDLYAVLLGLAGAALIIVPWAWRGSESIQGTSLWAIRAIATIVGLIFALIGYSYPALRYSQRLEAASGTTGVTRRNINRMILAACLSGVALLGTWGSTQNISNWVYDLVNAANKPEIERLKEDGLIDEAKVVERQSSAARSNALIAISAGAVVGTLIAAMLGDLIGRRWTYVLMCATSMVSIVYLFVFQQEYGFLLLTAAFLTGACTASFYGWLPLYLPELFGTSVRATGQGFGFNFGRVLAAVGTLQIANLLASMRETFASGMQVGPLLIPAGWPLLCTTLSLIYVVGMILIWFAPETKGQPLPE